MHTWIRSISALASCLHARRNRAHSSCRPHGEGYSLVTARVSIWRIRRRARRGLLPAVAYAAVDHSHSQDRREFDWLHIKPPVCARGTNNKLCVIDGQHTAIVAASRGVATIPVMIVEAPEIARRARAFVAHGQIDSTSHRSSCSPRVSPPATGALAARRAAKGAGVTLCRVQPANCTWGRGRYHGGQGVESLWPIWRGKGPVIKSRWPQSGGNHS